MSISAKSLGALLLVITPAISLLSASLYFQIIADATELFPANIFTLQDHFDKAIDLLIPVFLMYALATCIGIAQVEFSEDSSEPDPSNMDAGELDAFIKKGRRKHQRWKARITTLTILWMFFMVGPIKWLALFGVMLMVTNSVNHLLTKVVERMFNWDHENTNTRVAFATTIFGAVVVGIVLTANSDLFNANKNYWDTREEVIIDRFGSNYFVVRDDRYHLIDGTGSPVFMGERIPARAESIACKYIKGWACWNSRDLTGDEDDEESRP